MIGNIEDLTSFSMVCFILSYNTHRKFLICISMQSSELINWFLFCVFIHFLCFEIICCNSLSKTEAQNFVKVQYFLLCIFFLCKSNGAIYEISLLLVLPNFLNNCIQTCRIT